jgi:hypothetical protein
MADPFNLTDPSSADPSQGFGGIPADTWRNLMSLGAGMSVAANARNGQGFLTYGNGLAGPLGAGIQSTLGQSGEIAGLRSQLAQRQAQTQGQQIQNSGARVQNAMNLGRYNMAAPYLGQPTLDAQGNVAPQPAAQPAASQPAADTSGGDVFDRMPGPLQNVVASSAAKYGIPPKLGAALLKQESDLGLASSNVGQILPSTAAAPGYGVPPLSAAGVNDPMQNIDFSMRYLAAKGAAAGVKDWTDPQQAAVGLAAYNGGGDPQYVQHVARFAPSIFGGGQSASASTAAPQDLISGIINGSVSINSLTPQQAGSLAGNPALNMLRPDIAKALTGYAMAGPTKASESANSNVDLRQGGMARVQGPNGQEWIKNPQLEKITNPDGSEGYAHIAPPLPGEAAGTAGNSTPVVDASGKPIIAQQSPTATHFQQERGHTLGEQFNKIDADASSAIEGNYLFNNLRNDSQTWDMGKFADIAGDAKAYVSAISNMFNVDPGALDKSLGDYQAFTKSAGMLLRTAVHDVSSRAAVQEYNLISETLPHPTTSAQGFGQIADQWQGLNDFRIAKQIFASKYQGQPQDFNVAFNSQISPTAFLINRMAQTPQGQQDMTAMMGRLQATPEGRVAVTRMMQEFSTAKGMGLFDLTQQRLAPPTMAQPASAVQ